MHLRILLPAVAAVLFAACSKVKAPAPPRATLDSVLTVPVSTLKVPVYYVIQDVEDVVNEKIGKQSREARVAINPKGDSLFLTIQRFEPVTIQYNGHRTLSFRIPLDVNGFFRAKKLGIKIQNSTPIHARMALHVSTQIGLDPSWNLKTRTTLHRIEWMAEPRLNIAGVKVNLRPPIDRALENHKADILAKIDGSLGGLVKLGPSIEKVWLDLQKPIRINHKVVPVWLKTQGRNMSGRLMQSSKDTLAVEVTLETTIESILDSASHADLKTPLPKFHRTDSLNPGVRAFVKATIPFEEVNRVVGQITDTMTFRFSDRKVKIRSSEVYGTPDGIAVGLSLAGDVRGEVYLRGNIGFDSLKNQLVVSDFSFDVASEQSLVQAADWFTHGMIIERIAPYLTLPMDNTFRVVPALITKGIEKGKLGRKIDVHWSAFDVRIQQHLVTRENIQVILLVTGKADVKLEKGLLDKKKPVNPPHPPTP